MSSERPKNYFVSADGTLMHKRWLNQDGTRKEGADLKQEQLRAELQSLARRLLDLSRELTE